MDQIISYIKMFKTILCRTKLIKPNKKNKVILKYALFIFTCRPSRMLKDITNI